MTLFPHVGEGFPLRTSMTATLSKLGAVVTGYIEAKSRRAQYEALMSLSDDRLSDLGLNRDGIADHTVRAARSL
ncbi:DUF1127 domain-containing protein [Aliiroseovarius subalbicans]|uniref:DUF1127 domain-containing protein n=1 Tax=Aliiroseovarius subalbicans TaxID=2925840 RepID=UPI001F56A9BA|nr:DUF1127 domain-containing protein [Aliiroseovarius subalbicans]MCI2400557.1 hypothetical protein [Aliiroseovarius subalbicans]